MQKKFSKGLFIFRRDLRIHDNTALIEAINNCEVVIPIFNFEPKQINIENRYRSLNTIQFMIESLQDLAGQFKEKNGKIFLLYGDAIENIEQTIITENINAVFFNFDYTPFSIDRDNKIKNICIKHNVAFQAYHDILLIGNPNDLKTSTKKPYTKFNAFLKQAYNLIVAKPKIIPRHCKFYTGKLKNAVANSIYKKILTNTNQFLKVHGGTQNALNILKDIVKLSNYNNVRDYPGLDATTHLSAANKFGTISIRELYYQIKKELGTNSLLIKELYWRDFFTYITYHFPHVIGEPFFVKYKKLEWSLDGNKFKTWCLGNTGFPIVDAAMRQLNTTGWMHNRTRMIVASFLVKLLHINWLWGERYFAEQLVDYDPAVNNGNWQWIASTGANAQPYFRVFNPWLQQKKYDPDCKFIKEWLPELKNIPNSIIHNWYKNYSKFLDTGYIRPILNYEQEKAKCLKLYKKII